MKTNKELLQLAARAAGITGEYVSDYWPTDYYAEQFYAGNDSGIMITSDGVGDYVWNPLTDSGDALRLAVDLDITFTVYNEYVEACYFKPISKFIDRSVVSEPYGNDKHAATRRAIVRAAAAIGERTK